MTRAYCPHCKAAAPNLIRESEFTNGFGHSPVVKCLQCGHRIYREFIPVPMRPAPPNAVKKKGTAKTFKKMPCTLEGCTNTYSDNGLVLRRLCRHHSHMVSNWNATGRSTPVPLVQTATGWIWNPEYLDYKESKRRKSA